LTLDVPNWSTIDWRAAGIAGLACLLTFYWKKGLFFTLLVSVVSGALLFHFA
jgi:hypothetical protein